MDPGAVLPAERGDLVAVKDAGNGAFAVEMGVEADCEDAPGREIAAPGLEVLLRAPEAVEGDGHWERPARRRVDSNRRHGLVGIEAGETELLADEAAGQLPPLEDLRLRGARAAATARMVSRKVRRTIVLHEITGMAAAPVVVGLETRRATPLPIRLLRSRPLAPRRGPRKKQKTEA